MAGEGKIISVTEGAKFLRVHPITLYRMLEKGKIPGAFKLGRIWRLDLEQLERFLEARSRRRK
jgi:excisionase family DNA binding protein